MTASTSLRADQKALLQLLCEREQSYEDISGLLGVSAADVQRQAREALGDLGGADPDAEIGLSDYLLGQADPIGRADAVRFLQTDPETLDLAKRISAELLVVAPAANLPNLPEPRGRRSRAAMPAPGEAGPPPSSRGSDAIAVSSGGAADAATQQRQTRLIAGLAALGVILLFVILAVAGVFSSDDGGSTPVPQASTTPPDSTDPNVPGTPDRNIVSVKLQPSNGSGVGGTADFGVANQQPFVALDLQGLTAAKKGNITLVWLMIGDTGGFPINNPQTSPIVPDQNGNYSGSLAIPTEIGLQATSVRISESPIAKVAKAAQKAQTSQVPVLPFIGTELAAGDIPAAARGGSPPDGSQAPDAATTPGG